MTPALRCGDGIVGAFARLVARRASDEVVVSPGRRATFGEVDSLSRALSEQIAAEPIEGGRLVGLAAPNGPAFLAGFLALRRAGQAVLLLDPRAPFEDRRRALAVLGTVAVLECTAAWPSSTADFRLSREGATGAGVPRGEIAAVKTTSGSTGAPRGIAVPTEALLADEAALAISMGLRDDDRFLASIPMSHSYGFTTLALSALVRGRALVLPADEGPFAPLAAARQLGATVFPTVPAYVQGLLKMSRPPAWPSVVRLVISAGAILPGALAARFRETYGQPIHVLYGSSECGGICYDREGKAAERGTVGAPVDGVRISLRPLGGEGEGEGLVTVESAAVGETYLPEPDPRLSSGRFETSDVAAWAGGELVLRRRVDRIINVRGRKVDPSEVESVLAALQGVEEAVVIGLASPDRRDEIVRAVVACPSGRLGYEDVAAWCRPRLADHKVPRSVVIVDAIPRTPRGKIDRRALLELRSTEKVPGVADG
jgi:long-chain acyl-CoA synthetase